MNQKKIEEKVQNLFLILQAGLLLKEYKETLIVEASL
jgi:hypothetical protein